MMVVRVGVSCALSLFSCFHVTKASRPAFFFDSGRGGTVTLGFLSGYNLLIMLLRRTCPSRARPSSLGRLGTKTEGAHELIEARVIGSFEA